MKDDYWDLRCAECGRFISAAEIEDGRVMTHYTPDTEFGPERIEHVHRDSAQCHYWDSAPKVRQGIPAPNS